MNEPANPGLAAFEDQIRAADAHAAGFLAGQGRGLETAMPAALAPAWQREAVATMDAARKRDALKACRHLTNAPAPAAILVEAPHVLHCLDCYARRDADRRCSECGRLAGRLSLEGGLEDVIRGPVVIWSRVRCARCARSATAPGGTFGNG
ncbi:hypothetical protein GCM10020229_80190 [Kitasatospora albolonga]|uniref:hypothetical protein n=1 Tax=Kitasatospora albolonga TaxID=68173 RepID=UPI0031F082EE